MDEKPIREEEPLPRVLWQGTFPSPEGSGAVYRIVETFEDVAIELRTTDAAGAVCWRPAPKFRHLWVLLAAVRELGRRP